MLREFKADLHIHTCLSPCGDLRMSPRNIVAEVLKKEFDIIAICDHNSAENIPAVIKSAEGKDFVVLPGMEVCTREEIHVLAIFENLKSAFELQSLVYDHLHGENNPEVFGLQVVANEFDEVLGFQNKLLIGAVDLSIEQVVNEIHRLNGLAIASHIDRESYSIIGQLGFIPDELKLDALEISQNIGVKEARKRFGEYQRYQLIQNSDAHFIDDVGKRSTRFLMEKPSFNEIRKALRNEDGRRVYDSN
jgi:predicted metal-dependent phosphoesterase TrpH